MRGVRCEGKTAMTFVEPANDRKLKAQEATV